MIKKSLLLTHQKKVFKMRFTSHPTAILLSLLFILLTTSSCSKEEDNGNSTITLITRGPWKFSKATASGVDVSGLIESCIKDNILIFQSGTPQNTGSLNEGATRCNPTDPQMIDFFWEYDASFRKITITGVGGSAVPILPGGSNEFNIVRISQTEMVLTQNVSFSGTSQLIEVILIP
jgi:hypothetical protein